MTNQEKSIEKKLREGIKNKGGLCLKLVTCHFTGLPDRVCLLPDGSIFFAEIKTKGVKPTKIQTKIHSKLRELGFQVLIIDSNKRLQEVLR